MLMQATKLLSTGQETEQRHILFLYHHLLTRIWQMWTTGLFLDLVFTGASEAVCKAVYTLNRHHQIFCLIVGPL